MRKLYLHILSFISLILIIEQGVYSQFTSPYGITGTNSQMIEKHTTLPAEAFHGRGSGSTSYDCCGYQSGKNTVTIEKQGILLSTVLNQIGAFDYSGSGYTYTSYGSDPSVNVYMCYLNDNDDFQSTNNAGYVDFQGEIIGVYLTQPKTEHWSSSEYSSSYYPSGAPIGREFEPQGGRPGGNPGNYTQWNTQSNSKDWFQISNSYKRFKMGCENNKPGDWFRVVTLSNSCSEPTGAGSIGNPQNNCGSFNPSSITNTLSGSGGSGGTATYFWQSSTTSNSSNFSTIPFATSTTYNPSTISQTTWYRRGYYRCGDPSAAVYTDAVEMTVGSNPTDAGSIGNAQSTCSNSLDPSAITNTSSPIGGTNLTYLWEYSINSASGPWIDIPQLGSVTVFSSDCDNATGWSGDINSTPDASTNGSWCIFSSPTNSSSTGPNSAQSGSYYFYFETSGTAPQNGSIVSQALDLSSASSAQLSFYLHAYGAAIGTLNVGVSTSSSGPFTTEYTVTGQQQTSGSDPWTLVTVDLSSYTGQTVYIEYDYTGTTGSNYYTGDIAIDNILVTKSTSHGLTYDPSTITQTTWYRRGAYGNGCSSSSALYTTAVEMTVNSTPTASASASSSSICNGQSTTLSATTVSGATYEWRISGNSTILSTSSSYSPSPSSNTTYELTVTKNGCSATDNVTVTVGTEITGAGSINGAESQCTSYDPGNIVNSLDAQGGSGGTLTYFWEVSTTSNSTGFTTIAGATSASYDPSSTITQTTWYRRGAYRCSSGSALYTSAVQKTVVGTPAANASASSSSICAGANVTLSTSIVAGQTYQWSTGGSIVSNSASYTASPSTTSTYQLTVTQYGCSATDDVTVTVNDAPNVGVSGGSSQAACQGGNITLSGTGASSYSWNNGVVDGQSFSAPANTTTYTVTGTDANGCTNTAQVTVNITSLLDWANLQFPASETYSCNGGQIAIYGQVYEPGITDGPGQGGGITVEYGYSTTNSDPSTWTNWYTATYNTDANANSNDEYNGIISQALYALTPATYYYTFRYKSAGCDWQYGGYSSGGGGFWDGSSNVSGVLTVTPESATFSYTASAYCKELSNPSPTVSGVTGGSFTASPSGLSINTTSGAINLSLSTAGTYTVTYTTPNCSTTSTQTVTIYDSPTADAGSDISVCEGQSASLSASGGNNYVWSPTTGLSNPNIANPTVTPTSTTTYTVTVTDGNNCTDSDDIIVTFVNDNTAGTASSTPTLCINTALTNITHTTTGATGIGSATGLPNGVSASWSSNTITLSGTPTESGTFSYTVPLTGGCGTVSATGTITVNPDNTAGTASYSPTLCINTAFMYPNPFDNSQNYITHATTGATGIQNDGVAAANGLPAGVSASWSGDVITISGTPTATGTFNYTIPLTGGCGSVNATGTITVTGDNTAGTASSTPTLCVNTALTDITIATTGATGIANVTDLPAGVTASWSSDVITISGTPTATGTFNYTILLTGGCGNVDATGTIIVTPDNTAGTASSSPTVCKNSAITNITHTTTGATGIGTSSGLPAGVTASWSSNTITISGTPTSTLR